MSRTLLKVNGMELSNADLAAFDKAARRRITKAKQRKQIKLDGNVVQFSIPVRGALSHEIQSLLRALVNIKWHGKAYAPDEASQELQNCHHAISIHREFELPVKFDLLSGEITINWFPPSD